MRLCILLFLPLLLNAVTLSTLIENAKSRHISLQAIEQKLSAVDDEYDASRNFSNPELSLSVSDIQLNDISNRSKEPMQYSAVNIKQKVPYFGKIDAQSNKVNAKKQRINYTLEEAKVKLIETLKVTAYAIWQVEQEVRITNGYIRLMEQNIDLYTSYSSSDGKSHMGIVSAELSLSELKIKKNKFESMLEGLYKKLSYLSAMNVSSIEIDIQMSKPKSIEYYKNELSQNSTYKIKEAQTKEAGADVKVKELASYVDPSVQVGYYHRDSFEDYVSVGVGFSLPIYGTERAKEQESRKLLLATKSQMNDFKNSLDAKVEEMYAKLQYAYKTYNIIKNESMPEVTHMFDLTNSSIQSGGTLFEYIDVLQKRLSLEEQSIDAVALYYKTLASLEAMTGEMK